MTVDDLRATVWKEIKASGQTIHHIAKHAGISHITIRRLLWDEGGMTVHSMIRVLDALGMEMTITKKADGEGLAANDAGING